MPISAFKAKHQTLKLFSIPSKSPANLFSSIPSSLTQHLNANPESQFPHSVITPPLEASPNFHDPPISDRLFRNARKLGSYRRGDSTFYSLIEHHAKHADFRALDMVFERMKREKRSFIEKNFILVFRACGKAHLHHKAVDLFDRMVDEFQCKQTVKSFNSVLNVIIQQGVYHHALEFYDHVINNKKNILPNVLTFNLVIKALCKLGLVSRAIDVFREMSSLKCEPDAYTYCTLMDGLCKEDRIDDAVALFDEMQIEGCSPSPATFNVLINGLCKKGDLARAAKLVDNMFLKGCVPNEVTYNTLIHGLCLKGKLDKAVSLLARMLSNKLIPNDVTYGTIINGLVKQRRAVDGVHVLMAMEERGYKENEYVYSALISGLFKEGKSEEALNLWSKMIGKGCKPNIVVYSALIDGLCREGKPYEAEEAMLVWKEMVGKDYMDNEVCYSVLLHGLCKNGKLKDALMVWKHVLTKGLTPDVVAYSSMIHGLCNAGYIKQGLNLFNEMLCKGSNSKPDVVTYNILLNALCRQDNISHAIDLLNSMLNQGCDPDSVTCKILLTTLKEKHDPPLDGREFLDELILKLHKRQRIVGACKIIEAEYSYHETLGKIFSLVDATFGSSAHHILSFQIHNSPEMALWKAIMIGNVSVAE
ncbi:hypothetical protein DH2020_009046 [Rehmannia glutinosa]|uniref:Pentatricopeptide repeat-containing protein n=1 Tax=Rehmannia glutinosa TaxID=99300 RepID=A0ABR0X564_REHGL